MKEMLKQYLDQGISRRKLMKNLTAVGLGAVAIAFAFPPIPKLAVHRQAAGNA